MRETLHVVCQGDDRAVRFAIDTLLQITPMTVRLHIVGNVDRVTHLAYAERLGVADYIDWHIGDNVGHVQDILAGKDVIVLDEVMAGLSHKDTVTLAARINRLYRHREEVADCKNA